MEKIDVGISKDPRRIDLNGPILVAHQPEFMPWLGNISKSTMGDAYFILDTVQYQKKYFQNRNKIRIKNEDGWQWLIIPVNDAKDHYMNTMEVRIANNVHWKKKHLHAIDLSYRKSQYFKEIFAEISEIYAFECEFLVDFLIHIIHYAFKKFEINVPVYRVSQLIKEGYVIDGKKSDLIINMCRVIGARTYVFGISGKEYAEKDKFDAAGISIVFQKFSHPSYKQIQGEFIPAMSFIDLLFNYGTEAKEILGKSSWTTL